jgi:hypothetical protein
VGADVKIVASLLAVEPRRPHIPPMPTMLLLMILLALGFALWSASRAAAERADQVGRDACRAAGVQWLDETVHANGLRLCRGDDGRLGFERTFRFEYSEDGRDRHIGRLILRGDRLVGFSGPVRATPTVSFERRDDLDGSGP